MLALGANHVFMPKFVASRALELIDAESVTAFIAVPTMLHMLARSARDGFSGASVRKILVGGGRCLSSQLEETRALFPNAVITMAYGMTETTSSVTFLSSDDPRLVDDPLFAGNAVRGVEVKTDDEGSLLVRGAVRMLGYYGVDPSETFDADGWFNTGDIGKVEPALNPTRDTGPRVWLYGRRKEMIKSGGENVAPDEVEAVLNTHPDVAESVVVGAAHAMWGEAVVALVTTQHASRTSSPVDEDSILAHCKRERLAGFKTPKRVLFVDAPERNSMGKVSRQDVLEIHRARIDDALAQLPL
jgi:acyl-activating enzyme 14